jgi:hypothetical protein
MKRTNLMMILAVSLALGSSWADTLGGVNKADVLAGMNKTEEHPGLAKGILVDGAGLIGAKDPAELQIPVRLYLPSDAERAKPLLMAPMCPSCVQQSASPWWRSFQLALSAVYWI